MTVIDFLKDIYDTGKERIKTPITGAYTLAFVIYNWRPIFLLLFSDAIMEDKIVVINNEYCVWQSVLFPLGIAVIYVVGVPYIMLALEEISFTAATKRKTNKRKIKLDDLILAEEILNQEYINGQIKIGNKSAETLTQEINSLKSQIEQLQETNVSANKIHEDLVANLKKELEISNKTTMDMTVTSNALTSIYNKVLEELGISQLTKVFSPLHFEQFINISDNFINPNLEYLGYPEIPDFLFDQDLMKFNADGKLELTEKGKIFNIVFNTKPKRGGPSSIGNPSPKK